MSAENGSANTNTRDAAERYLKAGLAVIPVPAGEKNPNRPGWQNERWTVEDVPRLWNNGQGIGVLWGEPSGDRVDVDLDWREARAAAPYILPSTRMFGRPGAPESHRAYRVTGKLPKTTRYKISGDGDDRSVVEILSTGTQSLVPPSLHASGERRAWYREQPTVEIDGTALVEGAADIATAALIARNWPGQGARHDYALAATGYIGRNLPRGRAERIMEAAVSASGDEEAHGRLTDVRTTLDSLEAGRPTTGGPTLDDLAPGVIGQLRRWHGWSNARPGPQPHTAPARFHLSDLGNSERLIARHGHNVRYVHDWRRWLVLDGRRWKPDDTGELARRAKQTVGEMFHQADPGNGGNIDKELVRHAMRSESKSSIEAMVVLAQSAVPVTPDLLDRDPWFLNCENGTIDLRTGVLREHRREDLITKLAPIEYDSVAAAPAWESFLERVLPDAEVRAFVQRAVGYSLTGDTRERVLLLLHGTGRNGKSTFLEAIREVMGDYAMKTPAETLLAKPAGGIPNDLARLKGARFVSASETEANRRLAEALVKEITGQDTISARFMRAEWFDFKPTHKTWLATNHKPVIQGTDPAIWDRIKLVPFTVRIPDGEIDRGMMGKLRAELPGILAWAVRGCLEWQRTGLGTPHAVAEATEQYRDEMDVLGGFIDECCTIGPDKWCKFADLYTSYVRWCEESNERPEKKRRFADSLTERGFEKDSGAKNVAIRRGIALRHDDDPDPSRVNDPETNSGGSSPDPTHRESDNVNPVNERPENVNPQNSCKTGVSGERVNEGYRGSGINEESIFPKRETGSTLTLVNSLTQDGVDPPSATPHDGPSRRLTDDEVERVKKLIDQGMSAKWARVEVLGEGAEAG
jgi:putative DNA primase/helicase